MCMYVYIYIYIYIYVFIYQGLLHRGLLDLHRDEGSSSPKTYPHPRIPVARPLLVFLCRSMFSSTRGDLEVGGGDNF